MPDSSPTTVAGSAAGSAAGPPRRVYLVATAGHPNYGDELILAGWLRALARRLPEAEVWVDCPSPGGASALLDGIHPGARFVDTLWRLCWFAPSEEPWGLAAWVQHAVNDLGRAPRWVAGVEVLREAAVVHVVGGGYIHGGWPRHIGLLAGAVAATRRTGARAVLTGQGLVPAPPHSAALLAALAAECEVVDLRDQASAELLRSAGVEHARHSCDDAFLDLPAAARRDPSAAAPEFMLCVQSDMLAVDRSRLADLVLATLRAWRVAPDNLGVVECLPLVDREVFSLVEHQLPGARFYPFAEVWRDGLPAAPGQTWLSTRFHPHLVAAASGAGGVAIPVSPDYYLTKHHSLRALGSGWRVLEGNADAWSVPELPSGGGFSAEVIARCHAEKAQLADAVYGAAPQPAPPVGDGAAGPEPVAARGRAWSRQSPRRTGQFRT
ncbi:MAG TPA: polysaccharide pyruvyl transferase family protein [Pseudonocardia sp.]|uniref:polysaccharide pyruvyl transferase family protein n=1 Tax=Pseudonocardia sp. TaxID=60912 RepID=UPI002F3E782C